MKRTLKEERKRRVRFYDIWFWSPLLIILFISSGAENVTIGAILGLSWIVLPILMCFRLIYFGIKRKDWAWVIFFWLPIVYFCYYLFVIRKALSEGKEKTIGHTKELKQREKKETEKKREKYHENIRRRSI